MSFRHAPPGLGVRGLKPDDIEPIAAILAKAEGYTVAAAADASLFALETIRRTLSGFAAGGDNEGLVVEDAAGAIAAFLLYRFRNRLTETFAADDTLGALSPDLFPADGAFLQIHDLWVRPDHRRRGVATALKLALEPVAAARRVQMIYTVTEADHTAVLGLNAALGYGAIYAGPMWDEVPRVALVKRLSKPKPRHPGPSAPEGA
jgi:GNAT superfamily N-acetyltransferase